MGLEGRCPRTLPALLIAMLAVTAVACSESAVLTQNDATAGIDAGAALNNDTPTYHLASVRLTLEKVVTLPDGMLGLRFSFGSRSPDCCALFPRAALAGGSGNPSASATDVVIPASDVTPNGVLPMHIWLRGTRHKPSFRIDLASLGVPTS